MQSKKTIILWLFFSLMIANFGLIQAQAQVQSHQSTIPLISDEFNQQVQLLNELSERRRINTFFSNQQSPFYGLQTDFVNTGKGNVTFVRRDLVVIGRIPIVIARIYDSSLVDNMVESDFSQGWQLSLAQTIQVTDNGSLLYRDGTAVLNEFIPATVSATTDFKVNQRQNSDIKSVGYNPDGLIQINYLTGWIKTFQKLGDSYRLVKIIDNNANQLNLSYTQNRLSEIRGDNNRQITINRDATGRIVDIIDDTNRTVSYHYNKDGQLKTVTDLAGHRWQYRYHGKQLLHKVIDPLEQQAAVFQFSKDNKIKTIKIRAKKYDYQYKGNETRVKDDNGNTSLFVQNDKGITTSVTNAEGFISSVLLNERNQIIELWHNGEQQAHITYDDNGWPSHYDINNKPTSLETLKQDAYQRYR